MKLYSPLRYPGGKAKVLGFMKELIKNNALPKKPAYVEPYAGGAAVALGLLIEGDVSEIYINDSDVAIYSFWNAIKNEHKKFIKKIKEIPISVAEWDKQSEIYKKGEIGFELGFAAFYLNRCNHSGVMKGGIIGGKEQKGRYKIGCRFNKEALIERIKTIAKFKDKINIYQEDTLSFLQKKEMQSVLKNCLLYLDPPYYVKGHQLYKNHYKAQDHQNIAKIMRELKGFWVVSYDNVPEIQDLYKGFKKQEFNLNYCVGPARKGKEVMFFSEELINIPKLSI